MDLRDKGDIGARIVRLDGRAHPRAAGPDDEHVVLRFHCIGRYRIAQVSRRVTIAACFTRTSCSVAMVPRRKGVLRIDRHRLGPRVYVLGTRVHEWHLGAALLLGLAFGGLLDRVDDNFVTVAGICAGIWLVAKDWRDLFPAHRDSAAWRLGLHVRVHPLRAVRRADPLPKVAAVTAGLAGLVNLASAVTPNIAWRNHLLLHVEPFETLKLSHAAAIPASMLLLVTSPYLWGRRQGALRLALVLLLGLTVLDLLKGLDLEAAAGSAGAAGVLWLGRRSFCVRYDPDTLRQALRRVPFLAASSLLLCALAVGIAAPESAGLVTILRATGDALLWQVGPLDFHDELGHLDEAIGVAGLLALAWCAYLLFRPLAVPRVLPGVELRRAARELVRRHGTDTLAYFKLRRDQHYLFSPDRRAFLGYRVEAGVLLVSGDPVGSGEAIPSLLRELSLFAETRGLRIAALGAGESMRPLWEQLGLRSMYLGDEAVVETGSFSLEGRPIRKVRQSVHRLARAGYRAEVLRPRAIDQRLRDELEGIAREWRGTEPARGF